MYDKKQLVSVKWSNKTRKYYESKGYTFTEYGDSFDVKAQDLPRRSKNKITVICDCCGKEYQQTMDSYNKGDKSYDTCSNKCQAIMQHSLTLKDRAKEHFDKARGVCKEHGYTLITKESEYTGAEMTIEYICPKHGLQTAILDNFIHGHECYYCSYEKRGNNSRYKPDEVKEMIEQYNNNKLLNADEYKGMNVPNLKIACGSCGYEHTYTVRLNDYLNNNQIRCKHCSAKESVGERRIRTFLDDNNIVYEQEKTFDSCKDINKLPFDFYLPTYNMIIEFDGQHHYFPVWSEEHYESTVKHDKIKNGFCKSHNIKMVRIPYWKGNDIETILTDELKLCPHN